MLKRLQSQKGAILVWSAVAMGTVLAMTALGVDVGWMFAVRSQEQTIADAAALSALVDGFPVNPVTTEQRARETAAQNLAGGLPGFVETFRAGNYNFQTATFTPGGVPINAVRITTARAGDTDAVSGNPGSLPLFFGRVLGIPTADIRATATAALDNRVVGNDAKNRTIPIAVRRDVVDPEGNGLQDNIGQSFDFEELFRKPMLAGGAGMMAAEHKIGYTNLDRDCLIPADSPECDPNAPLSNERLAQYVAEGFNKRYGLDEGGSTNTPGVTGWRSALNSVFDNLITSQEEGTGRDCYRHCTTDNPEDCSNTTMTTTTLTGAGNFMCAESNLSRGIPVVIQVFDTLEGSGSNAVFHVVSLVAVRIKYVSLVGDPNTRHIGAEVTSLASSGYIVDENAPPNPTMAKIRLVQ